MDQGPTRPQRQTSPQSSPGFDSAQPTGEGVGGGLEIADQTEDLSEVIATIEVLFGRLARHDSRFGNNDLIARRVEGWQHPALVTFLASKDYTDKHDLLPQDLRAIAWNLEKKLAEFEGDDDGKGRIYSGAD